MGSVDLCYPLTSKVPTQIFCNALKLGEQNPAKPTEPKREGSYNSSRGVTTGKPMALPKFAESPLTYIQEDLEKLRHAQEFKGTSTKQNLLKTRSKVL